jgi:ABC-type uncharacterized transport system permease subunit
MIDRYLLAASTLCFLLGFAYTMFSLGARVYPSSRFNLTVLTVGFVFQTAFLGLRGREVGRCPLTNLFEVVAFLSWAMVLFYLVIGTTYRLSPLGMFTAPLAFVLQTIALIAPIDHPAPAVAREGAVNPWLEFHAAFSVLACGAFALAGIAGAMYLWEERQLKTHRLNAVFFHLPPIADLGRLNARLLWVGFILLSAGLCAGIGMGVPNSWPHLLWAMVMWVLYGVLVQARWGAWKLAPRRVASLSVAAFTVALLTLGGLSFVAA